MAKKAAAKAQVSMFEEDDDTTQETGVIVSNETTEYPKAKETKSLDKTLIEENTQLKASNIILRDRIAELEKHIESLPTQFGDLTISELFNKLFEQVKNNRSAILLERVKNNYFKLNYDGYTEKELEYIGRLISKELLSEDFEKKVQKARDSLEDVG
jgi:hypothetical protein